MAKERIKQLEVHILCILVYDNLIVSLSLCKKKQKAEAATAPPESKPSLTGGSGITLAGICVSHSNSPTIKIIHLELLNSFFYRHEARSVGSSIEARFA